MTMPLFPRVIEYNANGTAGPYSVKFKFFGADEISVHVRNSAGVKTALVRNVHYTVTGGNGATGSISITASGQTIAIAPHVVVIAGATVIEQQTDYVSHDGFPAESHETALDRLTAIAQEQSDAHDDLAARAIRVPPGEVVDDLPAAGSRANGVLAFNPVGAPEVASFAMLAVDLAAPLTDVLPAFARGDVGPPSMSVGRWDAFETLTIPVGTDLVMINDTLGTAGGTSSFKAKLDPEQVPIRAREAALITQAVALGQTLANAQADLLVQQKYWRRQSANGRWFVECEAMPDSAQFGTPGDGAQSSTNVRTGTIVTAQLQAFINYTAYVRRCETRLSPGVHRTGALHAGWGDAFASVHLIGRGAQYAGGTGFAGTTLLQEDWTRPLLNFAGARLDRAEGITFIGPYARHMTDNLLGFSASPPGALDDLIERNWLDFNMPYTQDNRYNPHCLVAVDAYSGSRVAPVAHANSTAYARRATVFTGGNVYICETAGTSGVGTPPTGTGSYIQDGAMYWRWLGAYDAGNPTALTSYPDIDLTGSRWVTGSAQYNRNAYSSTITFRNCQFYGGVVGAAIKPSDNSLQGDFVRFEYCQFAFCKIPHSGGNHQARNETFVGCDFGLYHTAHTNRAHGQQSGAGHILSMGCSYGASIYQFDINLGFGGAMTFINSYFEAQARWGIVVPAGSGDAGIKFINPRHSFYRHPERGRCGMIMHQPTGGVTTGGVSKGIDIDGGILAFHGALAILTDGVTYNNCLIYDYQTAQAELGANHPLGWAIQASCGGLFMPSLNYTQVDQLIRFPTRNVDTGSPTYSALATRRGYSQGSRANTIPFAVRSVRAATSAVDEEIVVPWGAGLSLTKVSLTVTQGAAGNELNVAFAGASSAATADLQGFATGAIVLDTGSLSCYWVRSFDDATDTAILVALDNYRTVGGVHSWLRNPITSGSSFIFRRSGLYTPPNPVFFDCVDGSTAATNMGNSARVGTSLTTDMANGDYIVTNSSTNALFGATHTATISGITNGSPGSATFSSAVATGMGGTRKRLELLRRPRPANV